MSTRIEENTHGLQVGDIVYASPISCTSGRMGKDKLGYWRITEIQPGSPGWPPTVFLIKIMEDNGLPAKSKLPHRCNCHMVRKITLAEARATNQKELDAANLKFANLLVALSQHEELAIELER
jgi:hypothetical protein